MGTLKKRIELPDEIDESERGESGDRRQGTRFIFPGRRFRMSREDGHTPHFKHIGLYVYRRDFLLSYSDLPVGPLEQAERLEQLRALENGYRIRVVETEYESLGRGYAGGSGAGVRLIRSSKRASNAQWLSSFS